MRMVDSYIHAVAEEFDRRMALDPLRAFAAFPRPHPKQEAFFSDDETREVHFLGANRTGKTKALCARVARRVRSGSVKSIWIVTRSSAAARTPTIGPTHGPIPPLRAAGPNPPRNPPWASLTSCSASGRPNFPGTSILTAPGCSKPAGSTPKAVGPPRGRRPNPSHPSTTLRRWTNRPTDKRGFGNSASPPTTGVRFGDPFQSVTSNSLPAASNQ